MKKILSLLLVMLSIFAMGGGVYAENSDDVTFTGLAGGQNIYIEPDRRASQPDRSRNAGSHEQRQRDNHKL